MGSGTQRLTMKNVSSIKFEDTTSYGRWYLQGWAVVPRIQDGGTIFSFGEGTFFEGTCYYV